jgi:two-component system, LuxR family, sensor kinase FixL
LLETGFVETPYLISWAYLAILVAIASELHADVLAAGKLSLHLQESERRMDLVGAAAQLGTWSWDINRDRISASNQARSLLGLSTPELLGVEHFLSTTHQADRQVVERTMREAGAMNSGSDFEYRVQRRNGDVRWIATRVWPDIARDRRLLGVAIDVTERKAAELQAARDRAELRHMTRVSMLGQLSAYIAHELNQPLAAILGNAEAAQAMLERDEVDLVELRAICDDIVSEDHRASRIIQRLRDLFRRGDSKLEPLALNAIVGETLDLIHKELLSRNVMVATELASTLPVIEGDKVQLQQVLLNLIMNAADAMRDTALELRKLAIRTEMTVANVQLYVVDHGLGISEDDLKRVFDPFWTTKSGGMGIGLAICKSIVEAHRGTIVAANGEDGGASFCVTFPVRTLA